MPWELVVILVAVLVSWILAGIGAARDSVRLVGLGVACAVSVLVFMAVGSLAACGPDKATEKVRSGSYCQQAGASGQTDAGRPMVCATTGTDKRLRWRAR